jgi:hypothetical protein
MSIMLLKEILRLLFFYFMNYTNFKISFLTIACKKDNLNNIIKEFYYC